MILSCHSISKSFGAVDIIKNASFGIEAHEKAALVGINGAGKTTLLRIIMGEMRADNGDVIIAKGATIGYLAQQNMVDTSRTIYDEMCETKKHIFAMEEQMHDLEHLISTGNAAGLDNAMERYHRLQTDYENAGGYQVRSEITGVLKGLGFSEEEFSRETDTLSGGQKTRVALGRLLLSSPDIIILDEPTNHLDMNSVAWLENYLLNYNGTVLIVSHDRYFLNKVVSKVIEIDQGHVMTFKGNYTDYAEKKKQLRETALKAWMNQQQEIRHQQEVITKLRSFNREKSIKRAESREKMLQKIDVLEKPTEEKTDIRLTLTPRIISGQDVLFAENLSKSFGEKHLFSGINIAIRRGERVAIIGDNGTGKTTLLKIITGSLPGDSGKITLGSKVHIGYYDQEHQLLHEEKTLFQEISDEYPDMTETQIRDVLAAFLFTGDDVFKRIKELSGGERGRVALARLMLSKANFLILDEPTNHLDVFSKEILESALQRYTGTLLYVSHDRYFINQTATRIMDLTNGTFVNYGGNYDYYLEKKTELTAVFAPQTAAADTADTSVSSRSDWKKMKEEQAQLRKIKNDLKKTEDRISCLENRDSEIDRLLSREEIFTDLEQCTSLTEEKAMIAGQLEELFEQWEELAALAEDGNA